jgi:hypothetical protein
MVKKRVVIDASIARSCGAETAIYPTSVRCRDFLSSVRSCQHSIVMTPGIQVEWNKHQSRFAREWLLRMARQSRIWFENSSLDQQRNLSEQIEAVAKDDVELAIMNKDLLLLEAALKTDSLVTSLDEKARNPFMRVAKFIPEIQRIVWVNPDKPEEQSIEWLQAGAPAEDFRMLGHAE